MKEKETKILSLDYLMNNFEDLNLQDSYIHVPSFKVTDILLEPYRSDYYCIGFLKTGELKMNTNLIQHNIKAPAIIFADPASIKSWEMPSSPYVAESILISEDFLQKKLIENTLLKSFSYFSNNGVYITSISNEEANNLDLMFNLIASYTPPKTYSQLEIVHGIVYSIVNLIVDFYTVEKDDFPKVLSEISLQFRKAVIENASKERDLKFYADLLHIHSKYLSHIVRKETGRTAGDWIRNQVVLEAKILLQQNKLTITQIVDMLNFSDESTFGKYFKRYAGMSPNKYRTYIGSISM